MASSKHINNWLKNTNSIYFSIYAIIAAFCTYSCMYAFRKPFAVASFEGLNWMGIDYKILLITAQVIGYTLSKFIGIKVISEMNNKGRALAIVGLILSAGLALVLFAILPTPYNIIGLFLNGLPLGMVWGLVFSYLEGRQFTEVLGAGLCVSFILASGFVKTVGAYTMTVWEVSEFWMPVATGLIFTLPLIVSVWLLDQIPPPSAQDIAQRTKRVPMTKTQRKKLFQEFVFGFILLIVIYALLTAYRDFRDNFAKEIWTALGYGGTPSIFTLAELPVAFGVLLLLALLVIFKNNIRAFQANLVLIMLGGIIVGGSTFCFQQQWMSGAVWMILVGLGSYLAYIPFNAILFDRFIAAFQYTANVGFLMYLADAFGYLSSVGLLFYKNFSSPNLSWLSFFIVISYILAAGIVTLGVISLTYFSKKHQNWQPQPHKHAPKAIKVLEEEFV